MTTEQAIEITGLTKSNGEHAVLRGVDLCVPAYLDRMGELGFRERPIEAERDSWILIAAQMPEAVPALMAAAAQGDGVEDQHPVDEDLVRLLDTAFLESFPCAPRLLQLLEERGWTGSTNIRRVETQLAGS